MQAIFYYICIASFISMILGAWEKKNRQTKGQYEKFSMPHSQFVWLHLTRVRRWLSAIFNGQTSFVTIDNRHTAPYAFKVSSNLFDYMGGKSVALVKHCARLCERHFMEMTTTSSE